MSMDGESNEYSVQVAEANLGWDRSIAAFEELYDRVATER